MPVVMTGRTPLSETVSMLTVPCTWLEAYAVQVLERLSDPDG
jgi:hypothetical protein